MKRKRSRRKKGKGFSLIVSSYRIVVSLTFVQKQCYNLNKDEAKMGQK